MYIVYVAGVAQSIELEFDEACEFARESNMQFEVRHVDTNELVYAAEDYEYSPFYTGDEYNDSMDGDHESALASAGYGTDEDYGFFGGDEF